MDSESMTTTGGLIALALVLTKVVEKLVEWPFKNLEEKKSQQRFDPIADEALKLARQTSLQVNEIHRVVTFQDQDGVPLVYTPRTYLENQVQMAEILRTNHETIERLVQSQSQLQRRFEELIDQIRNTKLTNKE